MKEPTHDEAAAYLAAIRRASGQPEPTNGAQNGHPEVPAYPCFSAILDAADDPPQWLAKDFLLAKEYQLLAGEGGSFKTTVLVGIAAAVAGGYKVLNGFPTTGPQSVLLVSGEDSMGVLKNRLQAMIAGHGWDAKPIKAHLHALCLEDVLIGSMGWQHYLQEAALDYKATLFCFDPLADLIDFDENDNSKARPVIQWFRRLGTKGIATLLCHHYGKATEHKQGMARIRGASAWMNAARAIYTVEEKDGSRWLGCGKLSRSERPAGRELGIQIEHEIGNRAIWTIAKVALAHPPEDSWMLPDPTSLTPGERKALESLDRFPDEAVSWTRWKEVSEMQGSSLSLVIPRLKSLGFVAAIEAGKRGGRPQFSYRISPDGRVALIKTLNSSQLQPNSNGVEWSRPTPTPATPTPLKGVECMESVELPLAEEIAGLYSDEALELQSGPKPPPHDMPPEEDN